MCKTFSLAEDVIQHSVNETCPIAGDECLIKIADCILKKCSRASDIACRYGGEEFAIIMYGDEKQASSLAEAIRMEVYSMSIAHPAKNNEPVTVSVGYTSIIPNSASSAKILIERADKALYKAKNKVKNICVGFKSKVKNSYQDTLNISSY